MKKISKDLFLTFLMFLIFGNTFGQKSDCDVTLKILKNVFPKYELKHIEGQKVFETVVWENHALIPLTECHVADIFGGIKVIAFEIYMSDDPNDYINMLKEGIDKESDIKESSEYQGTGERLIQVIFYDIGKNEFIAKPEGFPLAELLWIDQGYDEPLRTDRIKSFRKLKDCTNTILLSIEEYEHSSKSLHYFFKYHKGKIITKSLNTCIEKIYEQKNKLFVHHIENCTEVENEDAEPENIFRILMTW